MLRVLVTGGTGFIGSHLVRRLLQEDCAVAVLVRKGSDTWRLKDVLPMVEIIQGDLTAIQQAANQIRSFAPEVVFHLAWHGAASYRYQNDPEQAFNNVNGSLQLVQLAGESNCRCWISLGSVLEYGRYDDVPLREDIIPQPKTLYGTAKYSTSLLLDKLCEIYGIRHVWLRLFWAYGPADSPLRMIPYVILKLLKGEKPGLSPGGQRWDYLYATDIANAIYLTAVTPGVDGVFNLGSGEAHTVRSIAELIRDLVNPSLSLGFGEVPYRPDQIMHLQADVSRLRQSTGWLPQVSLEEGLRRTVEWFRENQWRYER